ncbi:hypothetical protein [Microbacterium invictum]|uniref:Uncharacterized protein n=1 Tax=Microbacterium invictum TaxID=515415 RepID=A0ABZ0VAS4_9MICO|nr:hypothetical protein [Microbacterium invictum]WQB70737.1 hypothetical protein T9R20_01915 [Microbacterium invictum]
MHTPVIGSGLCLETVLRVLEQTPLAGVVAAKGPTIREAGFADAQFTVDALAKDAALAIAASDVPLPALRAAEANLAQHQAVGQGGWDLSVMASRREEEGDVTACIR